MKHTIAVYNTPPHMSSNDMLVGSVGVVLLGAYKNCIAMKTPTQIVCLQEPTLCWSNEPDLPVKIFPSGTKLEVIIGGDGK